METKLQINENWEWFSSIIFAYIFLKMLRLHDTLYEKKL